MKKLSTKAQIIIWSAVAAAVTVGVVIALFFIFVYPDFTDYKTDDPNNYKRKDGLFCTVDYLPEKIDGYTVNSYSYNTYRFLDSATEIFLDITVTDEQFDELTEKARQNKYFQSEQTAFYDPGYTEIVYRDYYDAGSYGAVGYANIRKVIYNKKTRNIIYEYFNAIDGDVFPLSEVRYFDRFNISEKEYAEHTYENPDIGENETEYAYGIGNDNDFYVIYDSKESKNE